MVIKQNWYGNDVDVTNLVLAGTSIVLFKTQLVTPICLSSLTKQRKQFIINIIISSKK